MHILVTGSEGFLGRKLTALLEQSGHQASGFDKVSGDDILDLARTRERIEACKPDWIVHLAAVADLNFFATNSSFCRAINVEGTRNILTVASEVGARVLFASTCCAYGNNEEHPCSEISPLRPTEPYALSKADSERDVLESPMHFVARLATFYGPGMRGALCPAVFLNKCHHGMDLTIHGSGTQTRTYTYIDDIASGLLAIVEHGPTSRYRVFNVSGEEATSVLELASLAMEVTQKTVSVVHGEDRKGQIFEESIISRRLQSLGWRASTGIRAGMSASYRSFLEDGGEWTQAAGVGNSQQA